MKYVPSLYSQTDALLLPTFLESFSGTYVEALHHGNTIFTSNYEFAVDVCQDSAFYFDPLDAESIFKIITYALKRPDLRLNKIASGQEMLRHMMTWHQAFDAYMKIIDDVMRDDA